MNTIFYVIGISLIAISLLMACGNWLIFWRRNIKKSTGASWVPLIGGGIGIIGIFVLPGNQFSWLWFVPLIVDFGCLPGFLFTALWYFKKAKKLP
jgi:hypothetical protein